MVRVPAVAEANDDGIILLAPDVPGACGWGPDEAAALERLRGDLRFTAEWLDSHNLRAHGHGPADEDDANGLTDDAAIDVVELVAATGDPLECDPEGFFSVDGEPYDDAELHRTRDLLEASRGDLLALVADLDDEVLDRRLVEGRRTTRAILDHVAIAEHWYLTRVEGPFGIRESWRDYPTGTFERLPAIRADVDGYLESLASVPVDRRDETWVGDGERWSHRKVLRRLVWHELLHYKQLLRLVPKVLAETG